MSRKPQGKHLVITFDEGEVEIEAVGFQGVRCREATRPFEDELLGEHRDVTPKPELKAGPSTSAKTGPAVGT